MKNKISWIHPHSVPEFCNWRSVVAMLAVICGFGATNTVLAAEISLTASPATQNFDAMGTSASASLPSGWVMSPAGAATPTYTDAGNVTAVAAQASTGSPTAGARYNWGSSTTERALGAMTSGSFASPNTIMVGYVNNLGSTITAVTLAFDYERYRENTAAASITFFYSTDGSTWTAVTAGDSGSFSTAASNYGYPKNTVNKTGVSITGLSIPNSTGKIYFRWTLNTVGANSQGLGLDNFSLTATSGATAPAVASSAATPIGTTTATLNGNVTSDGGSAVTDRGFVYKTSAGVTIADNQTTVTGTTGAYTLGLSSLGVNAQYFFKAYAINAIGTTLSSPELSFYTLANTPSAPTVGNPTSTTLDVAIGSGDGNPAITTYAIKEVGGQFVPLAGGALVGSAVYQSASAWGTKTVTGLSPSTGYSFTVQAKNGDGTTTSFGSAGTGTTAVGTAAPSVTTQAATSPTTSSATLNGTVTGDGGASLTDRGFYWSTTPGVTTSSTQLSAGGTAVAAFSTALGSLSVNTIYYCRAYAVNSAGTGIGASDVSFYTLANTPSAPTVSGPTPNSLNVAITPGDGNPAATVYAIQETTSGNYVQASGILSATAVYQTFTTWGTKTVTGLSGSTTYTFQVKAQNGAGTDTSFGTTASGTTQATPLAGWDLTGVNSGPTTVAATTFNANLDSANTITRGSGAASSGAVNNSFRTTGFQNDGISTANNDYFQETLSAASGFTLSLSTIDATLAGTASYAATPGVTSQFAYSLDGTTFALIGSPTTAIGTPQTMAQISVSSISALQNVPASTTIYIRYYASGQTATGGWGFNSPSAGTYGIRFGGTVQVAPSITGAATTSAFTTTYGTASAAQTFSVSGANLVADLTATAPTGFEVASDGATYGPSATFTQIGGSASGTLSVRLKATAPVSSSYDSQDIVLSSTGASSANITTASSGNNVSAATLTYTANTASMTYGSTVPSLSGSVSGFVNGENQAGASTGTLIFTTTATSSSSVGSYAINGSGLSAANYTFVQTGGNATALTISALSIILSGTRCDDGSVTAAAGILTVANNHDGANLTLSGSVTLAGSSAGSQAITDFSSLTLGGPAAGNYTKSGANGTVTITTAAANDFSVNATKNQMFKLAETNVLSHASGTGGTVLSSVSSTTANGVSLTRSGGLIYYNSPVTNNDTFTYTVASVTGGCTATATVTINMDQPISAGQISMPTNGVVTIKYFGIPGYSYVVQGATDMQGPWLPMNTNTAGSDGTWIFTDSNATNSQQYYRLTQP